MAEQIRVKAAPAARTVLFVWLCAMMVTGYSVWQAPDEGARMVGILGAAIGTILIAVYLRGAMRGQHKSPAADAEGRLAGLFTEDELRHRLAVWDAMSELWLDTMLTPGELKFIAQRIAQSKYDPDELEAILFMEVAPVVHQNLRLKEGSERKRFRPDWLRDKILDHLARHGHREVTEKDRAYMAEFMTDEWAQVQEYMKEYYELGV